MKNTEIRALSIDALRQQLVQEKDQLTRLNIAHAISPIENPLRIRQGRRLVARMETILTEKLNELA